VLIDIVGLPLIRGTVKFEIVVFAIVTVVAKKFVAWNLRLLIEGESRWV
jgi:hypothetical protein